jgi:hypothetical protein
MSAQMVLLPVFVLVGLGFFLLLWTTSPRGQAMKARIGDGDQFDIPVLFYILIAFALPLRHADLFIVLMSWVFVVTRFVHAGILVTASNPGQRGSVWFAGALVLLAMWVYFALRILLLI